LKKTDYNIYVIIKYMLKMKNIKGFTMVELIVAVSVFLALAAGAFLAFNPVKRLGLANDTRRWEDLTALAEAVELYQIDNDALPTDLSTVSVWTNQKRVICSSSGSLTCDGQTRTCLVVNDTDFLGNYIPALPVDPTKSADTDTGYYVTRTGSEAMTFGACDTYSGEEIEYVAKASLASHSSTCGDGEVTGAEACDDGDTFTEGCGNATLETAGTYCNSSCTSTITLSVDETCDSNFTVACWDTIHGEDFYSGGYIGGISCRSGETRCNNSCDICIVSCVG
jgi:prepilin-type N-terminal cleavage/methylation domain-containing protein